MQNNDADGLGAILKEEHTSLQDDFAVSRVEIDTTRASRTAARMLAPE
jgi:galactokinase